MASEQDANGCYVEPSDRVRRVARLALCNCSGVPPKPTRPQTRPEEGPDAVTRLPAEASADETPTLAAAPPADHSVLERTASSTPVGSGLAPAEATTPQPPTVRTARPRAAAGNRQVNYEDVLSAYQTRGTKTSEPIEITWEEWTARLDQFPTRQDAVAAMTIARTQAMSSGGHVSLPAIRKVSHDWTAPEQIVSPALARLVTQTQVGGVSGVIEDRTGLRMIRVVGRRPAVPTPAAAQAPTPAVKNPLAAAASAGQPIIVRLPACNCER